MQVMLRRDHSWIAVNALFDPGATHTVIKPGLLGETSWKNVRPDQWGLEGAAGTPLSHYGVLNRVVRITDSTGYARMCRLSCYVADAGEDLILGMDWASGYEPVVMSWEQGYWRHPILAPRLSIAQGKRRVRREANQSAVVLVLQQGFHPDQITRPDDHPNSSEEAEKEVPSTYTEYQDVFSKEEAAILPSLKGRTHAIELEDGQTPPWGPIYSLAEKELQVLREYLASAAQRGWIRRSTSPAGAPILFVPKKGGQLRLCVDYRGLNKVTRKDKAPLPLITEILDRLRDAKVYTKLDLKDAYHRLRIREGDEWKTAFRCRYGHFEYLVMPFGLVNAPATFQEYINDALGELIDTICIVYLDDILIYSSNIAEHEQHVRQVLERLRKAKLYANVNKCDFSVTKAGFLGFIVTNKGIEMEPERIQAIVDWPLPRSVTDVRSFLGFAGFYRRFIKGYSKITVPLTDLLKGDGKDDFQLNSDAIAAFQELKQRFQEAPILVHFNPDAPLRLETDASGFAIGAILAQLLLDRWHPVAYMSRKLSPVELRYTTPDTELLAIQEAFRTWRHYLAYSTHPVRVITDHLNHKYLASKPKLTSRQVTALDELCPFNFTIQYRPGLANPADSLSRRPDHFNEEAAAQAKASQLPLFLAKFAENEQRESHSASQNTQPTLQLLKPRSIAGEERSDTHAARCEVAFCKRRSPQPAELGPATKQLVRWSTTARLLAVRRVSAKSSPITDGLGSGGPAGVPTILEALLEAQQRDAFVAHQLELLASDSEAATQRRGPWEVDTSGLLLYKGRIYVPGGLRKELLLLVHDDLAAGHHGVSKTLHRLATQYYWQGMKKQVKDHVGTCLNCQVSKPRLHRPYGELAALPVPDRPFQEISMDFITGLPPISVYGNKVYDSILVIVDRFSKYAIYEPVSKQITSDGLATIFLDRIFKDYGMPEGIVTDRGTTFTSSFWRTFCHLLATKRRLSTAFHPQTDGQTERLNQILEHYIRAFGSIEQTDWLDRLPIAQFTYNTSYHTAHGYSPAEALRGFTPRGPSHAIKPLDIINEQAESRALELQTHHQSIKQLLSSVQAKYAKYYNRKRIPAKFQEGDYVLLSTKNINLQRPSRKLAAKYLGPYRVIRSIGDRHMAYQLQMPKGTRIHNVFHISNLEPFRGEIKEALAASQLRDSTLEPAPEYEVERIVAHKYNGKRRRYLVKWAGYDTSENSWLLRRDFNTRELLNDYDEQVRSELAARSRQNS